MNENGKVKKRFILPKQKSVNKYEEIKEKT
jgi:hypothetical protein